MSLRTNIRKLAICAGVAAVILMNIGTASASPGDCVTFCDEPATPLVKIETIFEKTKKPDPDKLQYVKYVLQDALIG